MVDSEFLYIQIIAAIKYIISKFDKNLVGFLIIRPYGKNIQPSGFQLSGLSVLALRPCLRTSACFGTRVIKNTPDLIFMVTQWVQDSANNSTPRNRV